MWGCSVCKEKDKRIEDLKEHLALFLNPRPTPKVYHDDLEADNVLNGGGNETIVVIDEESERKEQDRLQREVDLIFSMNTGG